MTLYVGSEPVMPPRVQAGFGDLPPNIVAGGCVTWNPATDFLDGDRYVIRNGVPTGMRECQTLPGAVQNYAQPTVLSLPPDLLQTLVQLWQASQTLAAAESDAQALCRSTQALTPQWGQGGPAFTQAGVAASAILDRATNAWNIVQQTLNAYNAADAAVDHAYNAGIYANPAEGAFVIKAGTAATHAPIAWDNVQAAVQCVSDEIADYIGGLRYFVDGNTVMVQKTAYAVATTFNEVTTFLDKLNADLPSVHLSDAAAAAVQNATALYQQLTALATTVGGPGGQASSFGAQIDDAAAANDANAADAAYNWMISVIPPDGSSIFATAIENAQDLAAQIHQLLDPVAKDVAAYLAQHPDAKPKTDSKIGVILAAAAAAGVFIVKKGILFG